MDFTTILETLNTLSPLGLVGLSLFIIWQISTGRTASARETHKVATNHLPHIEAALCKQADLFTDIKVILTRMEGQMNILIDRQERP